MEHQYTRTVSDRIHHVTRHTSLLPTASHVEPEHTTDTALLPGTATCIEELPAVSSLVTLTEECSLPEAVMPHQESSPPVAGPTVREVWSSSHKERNDKSITTSKTEAKKNLKDELTKEWYARVFCKITSATIATKLVNASVQMASKPVCTSNSHKVESDKS